MTNEPCTGQFERVLARHRRVEAVMPRFVIEHGVVHDLKTGQHVGCEAEPQHAERLLALLQGMEGQITSLEAFARGVQAADPTFLAQGNLNESSQGTGSEGPEA